MVPAYDLDPHLVLEGGWGGFPRHFGNSGFSIFHADGRTGGRTGGCSFDADHGRV